MPLPASDGDSQATLLDLIILMKRAHPIFYDLDPNLCSKRQQPCKLQDGLNTEDIMYIAAVSYKPAPLQLSMLLMSDE